MRVFTILIITLLVNCTPTIVFIDKNFNPPPDVKAALIPINPETIYTFDDLENTVKDVFENDQRNSVQIIADSLNIAIKNVLARSLHKISFSPLNKLDTLHISTKDNQCFDIVTRRVGKDSVSFCFWIPRKRAFDSLENGISVLFVISSIDFRRATQDGSPGYWTMNKSTSSVNESKFSNNYSSPSNYKSLNLSSFSPPTPTTPMQFHQGGGGSDKLEATVQFDIWDKNTNTAISYGEFKVSERIFLMMMTKNTWLNIFNKIGYALIQNSPF